MNTTIFIVRHGEVNNPDHILYGQNVPMFLSDNGRNQIKFLGQKLKGSGISEIFSSPLQRAVDSSNILAGELGVSKEKIRIIDDLTDCNIPALAGKSQDELDKLRAQGTDPYNDDLVALGNESRQHLKDRIWNAFQSVSANSAGKTVAIVSHGDPILILMYLLKNKNKELPSLNNLNVDEYPSVGSATKVVLDENGEMLELNNIA